jgi:ribosomal protein S18 acetylase RimI-like enzyme
LVKYVNDTTCIESRQLAGFFVGWPNPPSKETFLKILRGSYRVILAMDGDRVVGFINAVSDGVLSAYIPLLEVLPAYQSKGIGAELVSRMKHELGHLYMIDLLCDENLMPFYEKLGMRKATGALIRNYENQNGKGRNQ